NLLQDGCRAPEKDPRIPIVVAARHISLGSWQSRFLDEPLDPVDLAVWLVALGSEEWLPSLNVAVPSLCTVRDNTESDQLLLLGQAHYALQQGKKGAAAFDPVVCGKNRHHCLGIKAHQADGG